jgi:hypothetical protein
VSKVEPSSPSARGSGERGPSGRWAPSSLRARLRGRAGRRAEQTSAPSFAIQPSSAHQAHVGGAAWPISSGCARIGGTDAAAVELLEPREGGARSLEREPKVTTPQPSVAVRPPRQAPCRRVLAQQPVAAGARGAGSLAGQPRARQSASIPRACRSSCGRSALRPALLQPALQLVRARRGFARSPSTASICAAVATWDADAMARSRSSRSGRSRAQRQRLDRLRRGAHET